MTSRALIGLACAISVGWSTAALSQTADATPTAKAGATIVETQKPKPKAVNTPDTPPPAIIVIDGRGRRGTMPRTTPPKVEKAP